VERLNRAKGSFRDLPLKNDGRERWSAYKAQAWCEYLNEMRRFSRACCDSWLSTLGTFDTHHRERALKCIDEIEKVSTCKTGKKQESVVARHELTLHSARN
jgi:hypothetical protein